MIDQYRSVMSGIPDRGGVCHPRASCILFSLLEQATQEHCPAQMPSSEYFPTKTFGVYNVVENRRASMLVQHVHVLRAWWDPTGVFCHHTNPHARALSWILGRAQLCSQAERIESAGREKRCVAAQTQSPPLQLSSGTSRQSQNVNFPAERLR